MLEDITPVNKLSLTEHISKELEKIVLSDSTEEGSRLPSQNELAELFNVGTRTVREALKNLEAKGLVSIEQGRGTFVKKQGLDFYFESIANTFSSEIIYNKDVLLDLTKTRELFELNAIANYINSPRPEVLASLEAIVLQMYAAKEKKNLEKYKKLDTSFHQTLILATNNSVIVHLFKHLTKLIRYSISQTEHFDNFRSYPEHSELIVALKELNLEKATTILKTHLTHSYNTIELLFDNQSL